LVLSSNEGNFGSTLPRFRAIRCFVRRNSHSSIPYPYYGPPKFRGCSPWRRSQMLGSGPVCKERTS